ncbi:MAG: Fur family transcriptional regulator [Pseudomonadota bacterium]
MESAPHSRPLNAKEKRVAETLRAFARPVSAYDIIAELKDEGLSAPPTVYRALNRLIEKGLAHKLETLNAFVACAHTDCSCHPHGHTSGAVFAVCTKCSAVTEFEDQKATQALTDWANTSGFELESMTLELRGTCASCKAKRQVDAAG